MCMYCVFLCCFFPFFVFGRVVFIHVYIDGGHAKEGFGVLSPQTFLLLSFFPREHKALFHASRRCGTLKGPTAL